MVDSSKTRMFEDSGSQNKDEQPIPTEERDLLTQLYCSSEVSRMIKKDEKRQERFHDKLQRQLDRRDHEASEFAQFDIRGRMRLRSDEDLLSLLKRLQETEVMMRLFKYTKTRVIEEYISPEQIGPREFKDYESEYLELLNEAYFRLCSYLTLSYMNRSEMYMREDQLCKTLGIKGFREREKPDTLLNKYWRLYLKAVKKLSKFDNTISPEEDEVESDINEQGISPVLVGQMSDFERSITENLLYASQSSRRSARVTTTSKSDEEEKREKDLKLAYSLHTPHKYLKDANFRLLSPATIERGMDLHAYAQLILTQSYLSILEGSTSGDFDILIFTSNGPLLIDVYTPGQMDGVSEIKDKKALNHSAKDKLEKCSQQEWLFPWTVFSSFTISLRSRSSFLEIKKNYDSLWSTLRNSTYGTGDRTSEIYEFNRHLRELSTARLNETYQYLVHCISDSMTVDKDKEIEQEIASIDLLQEYRNLLSQIVRKRVHSQWSYIYPVTGLTGCFPDSLSSVAGILNCIKILKMKLLLHFRESNIDIKLQTSRHVKYRYNLFTMAKTNCYLSRTPDLVVLKDELAGDLSVRFLEEGAILSQKRGVLRRSQVKDLIWNGDRTYSGEDMGFLVISISYDEFMILCHENSADSTGLFKKTLRGDKPIGTLMLEWGEGIAEEQLNPDHASEILEESMQMFETSHVIWSSVFSRKPRSPYFTKERIDPVLRVATELTNHLRYRRVNIPTFICTETSDGVFVASAPSSNDGKNYPFFYGGKTGMVDFQENNWLEVDRRHDTMADGEDVIVVSKVLDISRSRLSRLLQLNEVYEYCLKYSHSTLSELSAKGNKSDNPSLSKMMDKRATTALLSLLSDISCTTFISTPTTSSLVLNTCRYMTTSCFSYSISYREMISKMSAATLHTPAEILCLRLCFELGMMKKRYLLEESPSPHLVSINFEVDKGDYLEDELKEKKKFCILHPEILLEISYIQSLYIPLDSIQYRYDNCLDSISFSEIGRRRRDERRPLIMPRVESDQISNLDTIRDQMLIDLHTSNLENYLSKSKKERMFNASLEFSLIAYAHFSRNNYHSLNRYLRQPFYSLALSTASREFRKMGEENTFVTEKSYITHMNMNRHRFYSKFDALRDMYSEGLKPNYIGMALKDQAGGARNLSILTVPMRLTANILESISTSYPFTSIAHGNCVYSSQKFVNIIDTVRSSCLSGNEMRTACEEGAINMDCMLRVTVDMSSWGDNVDIELIRGMMDSASQTDEEAFLVRRLLDYYDTKCVMYDNETVSKISHIIAAALIYSVTLKFSKETESLYKTLSLIREVDFSKKKRDKGLSKLSMSFQALSFYMKTANMIETDEGIVADLTTKTIMKYGNIYLNDKRNVDLIAKLVKFEGDLEEFTSYLRSGQLYQDSSEYEELKNEQIRAESNWRDTHQCARDSFDVIHNLLSVTNRIKLANRLLLVLCNPMISLRNGMMQGILQKTSSSLHCLTIRILEDIYEDMGFRMRSKFCTSDDAFYSFQTTLSLTPEMVYGSMMDSESVSRRLAMRGSNGKLLISNQKNLPVALKNLRSDVLYSNSITDVCEVLKSDSRYIAVVRGFKSLLRSRMSFLMSSLAQMNWFMGCNMNLCKSSVSTCWAELNSYQFMLSSETALYCPARLKMSLSTRFVTSLVGFLDKFNQINSSTAYLCSIGQPLVSGTMANRIKTSSIFQKSKFEPYIKLSVGNLYFSLLSQLPKEQATALSIGMNCLKLLRKLLMREMKPYEFRRSTYNTLITRRPNLSPGEEPVIQVSREDLETLSALSKQGDDLYAVVSVIKGRIAGGESAVNILERTKNDKEGLKIFEEINRITKSSIMWKQIPKCALLEISRSRETDYLSMFIVQDNCSARVEFPSLPDKMIFRQDSLANRTQYSTRSMLTQIDKENYCYIPVFISQLLDIKGDLSLQGVRIKLDDYVDSIIRLGREIMKYPDYEGSLQIKGSILNSLYSRRDIMDAERALDSFRILFTTESNSVGVAGLMDVEDFTFPLYTAGDRDDWEEDATCLEAAFPQFSEFDMRTLQCPSIASFNNVIDFAYTGHSATTGNRRKRPVTSNLISNDRGLESESILMDPGAGSLRAIEKRSDGNRSLTLEEDLGLIETDSLIERLKRRGPGYTEHQNVGDVRLSLPLIIVEKGTGKIVHYYSNEPRVVRKMLDLCYTKGADSFNNQVRKRLITVSNQVGGYYPYLHILLDFREPNHRNHPSNLRKGYFYSRGSGFNYSRVHFNRSCYIFGLNDSIIYINQALAAKRAIGLIESNFITKLENTLKLNPDLELRTSFYLTLILSSRISELLPSIAKFLQADEIIHSEDSSDKRACRMKKYLSELQTNQAGSSLRSLLGLRERKDIRLVPIGESCVLIDLNKGFEDDPGAQEQLLDTVSTTLQFTQSDRNFSSPEDETLTFTDMMAELSLKLMPIDVKNSDTSISEESTSYSDLEMKPKGHLYNIEEDTDYIEAQRRALENPFLRKNDCSNFRELLDFWVSLYLDDLGSASDLVYSFAFIKEVMKPVIVDRKLQLMPTLMREEGTGMLSNLLSASPGRQPGKYNILTNMGRGIETYLCVMLAVGLLKRDIDCINISSVKDPLMRDFLSNANTALLFIKAGFTMPDEIGRLSTIESIDTEYKGECIIKYVKDLGFCRVTPSDAFVSEYPIDIDLPVGDRLSDLIDSIWEVRFQIE